MTPFEGWLERLTRRLERENALFLGLIRRGRTLEEAEEALRACEMWVLWGLHPPQAALKGLGQGAALRYNPSLPTHTGYF